MVQIRFDEELQVLLTKVSGVIHFEDLEEHYSFLYDAKELPRNLNVLIDARYARFKFKPADVEMMVALAAECLPRYKSITEAILVTKPYETMVAMLFEESADLPGFRFKTFTTQRAALKWMGTELAVE